MLARSPNRPRRYAEFESRYIAGKTRLVREVEGHVRARRGLALRGEWLLDALELLAEGRKRQISERLFI
jgi:hypothetical protein